jgi:hypothetical protein
MNAPPRHCCIAVLAGLAALSIGGCGKPNRANIELRKENQALRAELEQFRIEHEASAAGAAVSTTQSTPSRFLFTATALRFGRLTGGADLDPAKPGDEAIKVYIVPTDARGDELKSAGRFTVEAFDLVRSDQTLVGKWEFPVEDSAKNWYGDAMLYTYVLNCPWPASGPPAHAKLTVKVTFVDALTGRECTAQREVEIALPRQ